MRFLQLKVITIKRKNIILLLAFLRNDWQRKRWAQRRREREREKKERKRKKFVSSDTLIQCTVDGEREKALLDTIYNIISLGPSLSLSSMLRYLVARRYTKFLSKLIIIDL